MSARSGRYQVNVRTRLGESTESVPATTETPRETVLADAWSLHTERMFRARAWWVPILAEAAARADAAARLDAALAATGRAS